MAFAAVLAEAPGHVIRCAVVFGAVARDARRRGVAVNLVLMAVLAFRGSVIPGEGKIGLAVIELERVPGCLRVALAAVERSELVEMRVEVAPVAEPVGAGKFALLQMAVRADEVVVHPLQLESRLLGMVEGLRFPIGGGVAGVAGFLEFSFMIILVAVPADRFFDFVFLFVVLSVALLALRVLVFSGQREFRLRVVVEEQLLPVRRNVALAAVFAQFPLVFIVLLVAVDAFLRNGFVFPLEVAFGAFHLLVFSIQLVTLVFGRIVFEEGRLEPFRVVAGFADLLLELALVNVLVTPRTIAGFERNRLVVPLDVAFSARNVIVFAVELESGVIR